MSGVPEFAAHATPEMAELIMVLSSANDSATRTIRRKIRYRLFRIRDNPNDCERFDKGLKRWMELQFHDGMSWNDFTFSWDVSAKEPLKLITPFEWDGRIERGNGPREGMICDPAAFTNQKK